MEAESKEWNIKQFNNENKNEWKRHYISAKRLGENCLVNVTEFLIVDFHDVLTIIIDFEGVGKLKKITTKCIFNMQGDMCKHYVIDFLLVSYCY